MNESINLKNYLIYCPDYKPVIGGAEIFIDQYTNFIKSKFNKVTVITRKPTRKSIFLNNIENQPYYHKNENLEIFRAPYLEIKYLRVLSSLFFTYLFFIIALIRNKYLFIHFIGFYPSAILWFLLKIFISNSKIIYTEQGMLVDVIRNNKNIYNESPFFLKNLYLKFFKSCDRITCVSQIIKNKFNEIDKNLNIQIIPNGTDLKEIFYNVKEEYHIISTSRLVQKNNIGSLVRAMPLVLKKYTGNKKIFLDIVGDGEERSSIEQLCEINHLKDIVILHGTLSNQKVNDLYKNSVLFCRLSLSEGFGISFIEALSWGLPIIGSKIISEMPYFSEQIGKSVNNIYDQDEISDAIVYYLNNENELHLASKNAIFASNKYDWKLINQSYINCVTNIISN